MKTLATLWIALALGASAIQRTVTVRVLSGTGAPLAGVKVYPGYYDPNGLNIFPPVLSDKNGLVSVEPPDALIAIGGDGSLAISRGGRDIRFGKTGRIRIRLIAPNGKPLK